MLGKVENPKKKKASVPQNERKRLFYDVSVFIRCVYARVDFASVYLNVWFMPVCVVCASVMHLCVCGICAFMRGVCVW